MANATNLNAKTTTINIRTSQQELAIIDRAAAALGKTRSEFVLDATRQEAEDVLLDRTFFALDDAAYEQVIAILDTPTASTGRLGKLLHAPAPWDE